MIVDDHRPVVVDAVYGIIREKLLDGVPLRTRVSSFSMAPLIFPGDEVDVEYADCRELRPGAIIAVRIGDDIVIHRMLRAAKEGGKRMFIVKGDAALSSDHPVPECNVIGRAARIRRRGKIIVLDSFQGKLYDLCSRLRAASAQMFARFIEAVRILVIRAAGSAGSAGGGAQRVFAKAYWLIAQAAQKFILRSGAVKAVWLRRSFAAGDWRPGRSDIDLAVLLRDGADARRLQDLQDVGKRYIKLKRWTVLVNDLDVFFPADLALFCRFAARGWEAGQWRGEASFPAYDHNEVKYSADLFQSALVSLFWLMRVLDRWKRRPSCAAVAAAQAAKLLADARDVCRRLKSQEMAGASLSQGHQTQTALGDALGETAAVLEMLDFAAQTANALFMQCGLENITAAKCRPRRLSSGKQAATGIFPGICFVIAGGAVDGADLESVLSLPFSPQSGTPVLCSHNLFCALTAGTAENVAHYALTAGSDNRLAQMLLLGHIGGLLRKGNGLVMRAASTQRDAMRPHARALALDALRLILAAEGRNLDDELRAHWAGESKEQHISNLKALCASAGVRAGAQGDAALLAALSDRLRETARGVLGRYEKSGAQIRAV